MRSQLLLSPSSLAEKKTEMATLAALTYCTAAATYLLRDKMNCMVDFVSSFLQAPLACLGSMAQHSRAGKSVELAATLAT